MNLRTFRTSVGKFIALIAFILDNRGLTPLLVTHKPRYSVFVRPKNDFLHLLLIPLPRVFVELYILILDGPSSRFINKWYIINVRTYYVKPFE